MACANSARARLALSRNARSGANHKAAAARIPTIAGRYRGRPNNNSGIVDSGGSNRPAPASATLVRRNRAGVAPVRARSLYGIRTPGTSDSRSTSHCPHRSSRSAPSPAMAAWGIGG